MLVLKERAKLKFLEKNLSLNPHMVPSLILNTGHIGWEAISPLRHHCPFRSAKLRERLLTKPFILEEQSEFGQTKSSQFCSSLCGICALANLAEQF